MSSNNTFSYQLSPGKTGLHFFQILLFVSLSLAMDNQGMLLLGREQ